MQSDGRIVLAGDADAKFGIARLNPDGSLDPNFGVNGKVIVDLNGNGGGGSAAYTVEIQTVDSDQRIVAAGYVGTRDSVFDFGLARFRSDGTLDNTFGGDGTVITAFGNGEDRVLDVVIDASNRIVAAGSASQISSGRNFALARYNSDGSLDSTFDGDGKVVTDFYGFYDEGESVAIQPDGNIIVAGVARQFRSQLRFRSRTL